MRKLLAVAILAVSITACKKTADGDLQVEKPVIGTVTDTLHVPSVEVSSESTKVAIPKVEMKQDSATIKVPTVKIKR